MIFYLIRAIKARWKNAEGRVSLDKGDLSAAMESFQEALRIVKEDDPNSLDVATFYNNIGLVLHSKGDMDGALEQCQHALAIQEVQAPNSLTIATSCYNIGSVLYSKGDMDGAFEQYQRALAIREVQAPNSLIIATSYNNIGSVLKDKGDMDGAFEQYQRALAIQEVQAPNSLTIATSYNNIGSVLDAKGDLDGALEQYQRALAIKEVKAPNSLTIAISYNNIGSVLKDKGDLDGALKQYQRALAIQEVQAPNSLTIATSYNNIGSVLKDKGDLDGALEQHRRALQIRERDAPNSKAVTNSRNSINNIKAELDRQSGSNEQPEPTTTDNEPVFTIPSRIGRRESNALQQQIQKLVTTDFSKFYPKVIISYANGQRPNGDVDGAGPGMFIAAEVVKALYKEEIPCFSGLMTPAGNNWEEYFLRLHHKNARVLVVLLSKAFFQSLACLKEVHSALQNDLVIIPVRVEGSGRKDVDIARDKESMWPDALIEKHASSSTTNDITCKHKLRRIQIRRLKVKNLLTNANTLPARGCLLTDSNDLEELVSRVQGIFRD